MRLIGSGESIRGAMRSLAMCFAYYAEFEGDMDEVFRHVMLSEVGGGRRAIRGHVGGGVERRAVGRAV